MSASTDRELMLFVDDELEGLELRQLQARLETDEAARSKVAAMRLTGELLRAAITDPAAGDHPADSIADAVMASLDLSGGSSPTIPTAEPSAASVLSSPASSSSSSPSSSAAKVVSLAERRSAKQAARPADASKRIYALAAVAAAAAAAMALWARSPSSPTQADPPIAASSVQSPVVESAPPRSLAIAPALSEPEVEEEHAEVTAVDFGSRTGSVFYLPSQALAANVVAVVWINDEAPGESL